MVIRTPELEEFYHRLIVEEDLSYEQSLRIFESLYAEALSLGAINSDNIWDGFEVVLRITRAMQSLERARQAQQKNRLEIERESTSV